jgi:hypothetical protein
MNVGAPLLNGKYWQMNEETTLVVDNRNKKLAEES